MEDEHTDQPQVEETQNVEGEHQPEQHSEEPQHHDDGVEEQREVISPAGGYPSDPTGRISTDKPELDLSDDPSSHIPEGELGEVKRKTLEELAPIVDQLELPAEEKFRVIMMIIQALDDKSLLEKARETAHSIEDEHARAQALYDIVNEVNYFTNPNEENKED